LKLQRGRPADVLRLALVGGALTWLPVALLSLLDLLTTGQRDNLLRDPAVDVRLLISLPLIVLAEYLHQRTTAECVDHLATEGVAGNDTGRFRQLADLMSRRRAAALPGLVLIALALGAGALLFFGRPGATGLFTASESAVWSWARAWYCLVALPIYLFMVLRLVWHWLLWCWFLGEVSRLSLQLMPTHPDRRGGVLMLSKPSVALAPFFAAASALAAARWIHELGAEAADPVMLPKRAAVLVALALFVSVVPLFLFSPHMARARDRFAREYGALAFDYTRSFHERWIRGRDASHELLGTSDVQSLADMGTSYGVIEEMRSIPIGVRRVLFIAAATLVPLVPVALYRIPFWELVQKVLKVVV
jgi:hypothetical protein